MLARDVEAHGAKIESLQIIITAQAVQTQRMDDLDRRLEELRHWRGFIAPDGEYDRRGPVHKPA